MPNHLDLTSPAPATHGQYRRKGPSSSQDAAHRVRASGMIERHEALIQQLVKRYPGSTGHMLAAYCQDDPTYEGLDHVAILRRTRAMVKKGMIREGAKRRCDVKGGRAIAWQPKSG